MSSPNSPLLTSNNNYEFVHEQSVRRHLIRQFIVVFRMCTNRSVLMMREPSVDDEWIKAYAKPIVIIDLVWNFVYIIVGILVLVLSRKEEHVMVLRVWIFGWCLLCVLHAACVLLEYMKIRYQQLFGGPVNGSGSSSGYIILGELTTQRTSNVAQYMDIANFMLPFFWWIIGVFCVCTSDQQMVQESRQLYWLCVFFLFLDFLLVAVCHWVVLIVGLGVCCCLQCIIAVLDAVANRIGVGSARWWRMKREAFAANQSFTLIMSSGGLNPIHPIAYPSFTQILTEPLNHAFYHLPNTYPLSLGQANNSSRHI